jgi:hypothetical protein
MVVVNEPQAQGKQSTQSEMLEILRQIAHLTKVQGGVTTVELRARGLDLACLESLLDALYEDGLITRSVDRRSYSATSLGRQVAVEYV